MSELLSRYDARSRWWAVMAAYRAGDLSEGQAVKLLGVSEIDVREASQELADVAAQLWERCRSDGMTLDDDIRTEVSYQMRPHRSPRDYD